VQGFSGLIKATSVSGERRNTNPGNETNCQKGKREVNLVRGEGVGGLLLGGLVKGREKLLLKRSSGTFEICDREA